MSTTETTRPDTTCRKLHARFQDAGHTLTLLELKLVTPAFLSLEEKDASARTLHEQVKVLQERHAEAMRRIQEFRSDNHSETQEFRREMEAMLHDLCTQTVAAADRYRDRFEAETA